MLAKHGYLLRFFERRDLFRYLTKKKKKVTGKKEVTRNLSVCVIRKFNGFEILRKDLARKESVRNNHIDIVYKPDLDTTTPVLCYFCPSIHLGFRSYIGKFDNVTLVNLTMMNRGNKSAN